MARLRNIVILGLVATFCAACASAPTQPPAAPQGQPFARANTMLAKAYKADAPKLAPQAWDSAVRHAFIGHNVVNRIAGQRRQPSADEKQAIKWLAQEAYVRARLAFVRTQKNAVKHALDSTPQSAAGAKGETQ